MSWRNRALSCLEVRPSLLVVLAVLGVCYCFQLGYLQGLLATAMIASSLLLHELGHVVVASAHGVKVKRIGFAAAGGYTVREHSGRWWVEAESAAAGPLANLVLFLLLNHAGPMAHAVAKANLILAIGNLIPFPYSDGGRLWKAISSRESAIMAGVRAEAAAPVQPHLVEAAGIGRNLSEQLELPASEPAPAAQGHHPS